jgi:S1-C subfamily serine protease
VNDSGKLIGVTAAIESPVQANAGIGFAIPAAIVRRVVPALIESGSYEHPYLGLSGIRLSPEIAQAMSLPADQRGALVEEVVPGGPADNAGIQGSDRQFSLDGIDILVGGDVIVAIDGQQVTTMDDLIAYLNDSTEIGQRVSLTILRDGKTQQIEIPLEARPGNNSSITEVSQGSGQIWLGIQGISMDENLADAMGLDTSTQGVLVEQVQVDSPADNAGLRGSFKPVQVQGQTVLVGGDVIISMDDTPIHNVNELARFLQSATANQKVTISIIRGKKEMHLSVELLEIPSP